MYIFSHCAHLDILVRPELHQALLLAPLPAGILAAAARMVKSTRGAEDAVHDAVRVEHERVRLPDAQHHRRRVRSGVAQTEVHGLSLGGEQREGAVQRCDFSAGERVRDGQQRGLLEQRGAGGDEAGGEDGLAFVRDVEDHEEGL